MLPSLAQQILNPFIHLYSLCVNACVHVCLCTVCVWCLQGSRKGIRCPEVRLQIVRAAMCVLELRLSSLQEPQALSHQAISSTELDKF